MNFYIEESEMSDGSISHQVIGKDPACPGSYIKFAVMGKVEAEKLIEVLDGPLVAWIEIYP